MALVYAPKTGKSIKCFPADWGPHEEKTGRAADLSPSALEYLGIETDDEVKVTFPCTNVTEQGDRWHSHQRYYIGGDISYCRVRLLDIDCLS
jgi:hypothetical protein